MRFGGSLSSFQDPQGSEAQITLTDRSVKVSEAVTAMKLDESRPRFSVSKQSQSTMAGIRTRQRHRSAAIMSVVYDEESGLPTGETEMEDGDLVNLLAAYCIFLTERMTQKINDSLLPFFASQRFNANGTKIGALFAVFSVGEIVSNITAGRISDRYGRRPGYFSAQAGLFIGYLFTALSFDYWSLFVSRLICGMFLGTKTVLCAQIQDLFDEHRVPKYLGYVSAILTLAGMIGPVLSSGLVQFGIRVPFLVASLLGLAAFLLSYYLIDETHPDFLNDKKDDDPLAMMDSNDLSAPDQNDAGHSNNNHDGIKSDLNQNDEDDEDEEEEERKNAVVFDRTKSILGQNEDNDDDDNPNQNALNDSSNVSGVSSNGLFGLPWQVLFVSGLTTFYTFGWAISVYMLAVLFKDRYDVKASQYGFFLVGFSLVQMLTVLFGWTYLALYVGVFETMTTGFTLYVIGFIVLALGEDLAVSTAGAMTIFAGTGLLSPSTKACLIPFIEAKNAGNALSFSNGVSALGKVMGPIVFGLTYDWNKNAGLYIAIGVAGSAAALSATFTAVFVYTPEVQTRLSEAEEQLGRATLMPIQGIQPGEQDFLMLGTWFGNLLYNRS